MLTLNNIEKEILSFSDSISNVCFSSSNRFLAASSWEGKIKIYDLIDNKINNNFEFFEPNIKESLSIISCSFLKNNDNYICSTNLCGEFNISSLLKNMSKTFPLNLENKYIIDLFQYEENSLIGLDDKKNYYLIDINKSNFIANSYNLKYQAMKSIVKGNFLIVCNEEYLSIYDIRKGNIPYFETQHILKNNEITSIDFIVEDFCFILGSSQGKISVDFINQKENNYNFKCHRHLLNEQKLIYPVLSIAYDKNKKYFYSGGGDGIIYGWDLYNKKKIFSSEKSPYEKSNILLNQNENSMIYSISNSEINNNEKNENKIYYINNIDNYINFFKKNKN